MPKEPKIPDKWSEAEKWAWKEIRAGRIADFHKRYDQKLDPKKPDGWDNAKKDRVLSNAFLVTILTEESFRSVIPFKGVRINQACFKEKIDLQHAMLERQLWLENCRFLDTLSLMNLQINGWFSLAGSWFGGVIELNGSVFDSHVSLNQIETVSEVYLEHTKINGHLDLSDSIFNGKLNMASIKVGQSLYMYGKAIFEEVILTNAKICGQISMIDSIFNGKLDMNGIEVDQHLFIRGKATFKEVDLVGAKIHGQLDISSAVFDGMLNMGSLEVGQSLYMCSKSTFKEVNLIAARINGQLDMSDSIFSGIVDMDSIKVDQSLFMQSSRFPEDQEIKLYFARIGAGLDLSGATINAIDLTGTTIASEICLGSAKGHEPTNWIGNSRMVLRNTTVGAIQDAKVKLNSWPQNLELEGFEYSHLGGFGAEGSADILNRKSKWFIDWLGRDKTYSPQPYEQLAKVLHDSGYSTKANAIRFASRKRSRCEACKKREGKPREILRWLGLTLMQFTIGYGLGARYFRVLWWFAVFTLIGFFVLIGSIDKPDPDLFKIAWASFDQVLPIVTLNKTHQELILTSCTGWATVYFYIQKLIGYVLGGFLGAGLAGLTQKS